MTERAVVSRDVWVTARKALLAKEKELTRATDALSAERRALPMVEIDKPYVFDGPDGPVTLLELFDGQSQLMVYHFMFEPGWDEGCKSCSYFADNFTGAIIHLPARDTAFAVVSRAPIGALEAFRQRMGWRFRWLSSFTSDFNYDFHVTLDDASGSTEYNYTDAAALKAAGKVWMDELPGLSVFLRDGDAVYHTYSTYQRGLDHLINTYNYLDLTPLGRHEQDLEWGMAWVRYHDQYAAH
jgi:predicted dithiol-disulfide oxidoreductase (DUF899 family)